MFRTSNFDKLLDKATSNLRLDPDWPTILQICDLIRQNDCVPKYAVAAIKKKLYSQNPHQAMFALLTLESVVKNCGSGIHDEVGSKVFCETLRDLVKTTPHENLKTKILELIQAWAFAFRNSSKYRAVQDTVNILKTEGYKFPVLKESDAMFSADCAPEWAEGEVCHRCRVAFSLMMRRHHCRACGQVFCHQCSAKTSTLPKFGIEKEVRVCDACYDKVSRPPTTSAKLEIVDTSNDLGPTQPQKRPPGTKTEEELREEEELQLALALSQSEADHKEKERRTRSHIVPDTTTLHPTVSPSPSSVSASPEHSSAANSELSRYLDRNYWEQRSRDSTAPTAPASSVSTEHNEPEYAKPSGFKQQEDAEDKEIDEFVESLKSQVEIFVNRMKSNSSRGRSIANDTSVQTLFMNITAMHSRLLRYIQQQDDKRVYLESLQDKVNQVRDSRAALDTLRAEHTARLAAQAEAAERQRQMQMATKLQAMRKKKHEYLQYQRQLALQRVQEQEREMQMRQEQQKHQYMMSANSYYLPGVSMHQYQPGYPNQPMYSNPQYNPQMMPQPTTDGSNVPGQPQLTQANAQMGVNPGNISQSMPQLTNTSGMTLTQAPNQANLRAAYSQQLPMQQQLMLQQMHQMRMPNQPGMHQMMQNIPNGLPGQNVPQTNPSSQQLPKQNLPQQQPSAMISPMAAGQNMSQTLMNPSNPMLGMQMQNIRMPMMQGNPSTINQQMPGYPMGIPGQQNNQPAVSQPSNIQQPSQVPLPGQPMSLPGQHMMQSHSMAVQPQSMPSQNHIPTSQSMPPQGPQVPQTQQNQQPQQLPNQGQPLQQTGHHIMMQNQQMLAQGQNMPPGQNMSQGQNMPLAPQGQNIPQGQQMITHQMSGQLPPQQSQIPSQIQQPSMPQQLPQGSMIQGQMAQGPPMQQIPQQMSGQMPPQIPSQVLPQGQIQQQQPGQQIHQIPGQQIQQIPGQQIPQIPGQQIQQIPGQQMKMQQQNFTNGQPGPQSHPNTQSQQAQTPMKSENNNSTAELIHFD